jgi:hypothetical protein
MRHSLSAAVAAGAISDEAAFGGMQPQDVTNLRAAGFGQSLIVVRFQTGRTVLTVDAFAEWEANARNIRGPLMGTFGEQLWVNDGIRDVSAMAN